MPSPPPGRVGPTPLEALVESLDLEMIDRDIFRGITLPTRTPRVFGGQVAAQALVAAQRTVAERAPHSLHAYFLRPGENERPIVYEVDRIRDGRSYATRRVVGIQHGRPIFNLQASFVVSEQGYDHQLAMPPGPASPGELPLWRSPFSTSDPTDLRPPPSLPFEMRVGVASGDYDRLLWLRTDGRLGDDPTLHRCVAAYASDLTLLSVAVVAAGATDRPPSYFASLDHAMWFHRPFRVDEWLLYAQRSPSASSGRGLAEGQLFALSGELVATVVQEGVIRR